MKKTIIIALSAVLAVMLLLCFSKTTARADWKENTGMQEVKITYVIGDPEVMDEGEVMTGFIRCCRPQDDTMCNLAMQNDLCPGQ